VVFSFSPPSPVANEGHYTAVEDTLLTVGAPGVLANDSDPNGLPLTATLLTGVSHGLLALNPDGGFTYTPDAGYTGADSFTYQASNGTEVSNVATVRITVEEQSGGGGTGGGPGPGDTPELDSLALFATGLLGLLGYAQRRRRTSRALR
jgi:hypothetical protein